MPNYNELQTINQKGTRCQQLSEGFRVIEGKHIMQISAPEPSECGLQSFTHPFVHQACPPTNPSLRPFFFFFSLRPFYLHSPSSCWVQGACKASDGMSSIPLPPTREMNISFSSWSPKDARTVPRPSLILIPILQVRTQRLREAETKTQGLGRPS